jgi:hypothetical protein
MIIEFLEEAEFELFEAADWYEPIFHKRGIKLS